MKRILILHTSIGLGHKSIAENIGFYLEQAGYQVQLHDALKVEHGILAEWGAKIYMILITKLPFIWTWLYDTHWFTKATLPLRIWIGGFNYKNTLLAINSFQPHAVISTQSTCPAIIAYLKQQGLYKGLFGIAFSDPHLHRFWVFDQADFYLANTDEQKEQMVAFGTPAEQIFVCGMTLKPKKDVNISEIKSKFGISSDEQIILLASGSQGTDLNADLIAEFISRPKIRLIVLCGKNQTAYHKLSEKFNNTSAIILNYYSPIDELYAIADIVITKPGGLSVAEALNWGLPILISHTLPGGEKFNYQYLLNKHLVMPQSAKLAEATFKELDTKEFKKSLATNSNLAKVIGSGQPVIAAVNQVLSTRI